MTTRPDDAAWKRMAHGCAVYVAEHGAYPKGYGMGEWLGRQRSAARQNLSWMTPERIAVLDDLIPGWRDSAWVTGLAGHAQSPRRAQSNRQAPVPWEISALAVVAFWQQHQRWPSQSGQDDHETKIGRWLSAQRLAANRNRLRSERRVWLDERAPGWNPTGSQEDRWTRRAHQLSEWCREHNRLPAVTSETGASAGTERQLAHWFKNRRMEHRAGRLPAERELLLSELLGEFWKP